MDAFLDWRDRRWHRAERLRGGRRRVGRGDRDRRGDGGAVAVGRRDGDPARRDGGGRAPAW